MPILPGLRPSLTGVLRRCRPHVMPYLFGDAPPISESHETEMKTNWRKLSPEVRERQIAELKASNQNRRTGITEHGHRANYILTGLAFTGAIASVLIPRLKGSTLSSPSWR